RVVEIVADLTGGRGTVGMLGMDQNLFLSAFHTFRTALPAVRLEELTQEVNRIRQVKSAFEAEAMRDMGSLLATALTMFEDLARPGRDALEVSGEIEGFLRGKGCHWGRAKYSLDQRPYTLPAAMHRPFTLDDVIL